MSLRIRIILLVLLAIGLAVVINMVRKRVLELKYVLVWLFSDIILIFLVISATIEASASCLVFASDTLLAIAKYLV